jgi:MFS family permease
VRLGVLDRLSEPSLFPIIVFAFLKLIKSPQENNMISTAIPIITNHFKSLDDVGWYASAHFLGTSAFQVVPGKLCSASSTKLVYISSLVVYITGSAICGSSSSSTALIIGRAVSGAASAGIYPGTLMMVASSMPLEKRPMYIGLFGFVYSIASIAGPVLGGSLTDKASWRWIFYIKIPGAFIVLTIIAFLFKTPEGARDSTTNMGWRSRITNLDIEGNVTMTASLTCLLLALNWGGTAMAWSDPRIISLICIFGILLVGFVAIQMWKQEKATILPRLIRRRSILGALWFSFTLGSSFQIVNYYLPFWFQTVKGASALKSGVMYFPMVISLFVSSFLCGFADPFATSNTDPDLAGTIVSAIGYYTPFMIGSSILTAIGFGMLSTLSPQSSHVAWISYQVLSGMGLGLGLQQPFIVVQNVLNLRDIPTGTSIMILGQNLGAAIFASVSQNIFNGKLVSGLEHFAPFLDSATVLNNGAANLQDSIEPQYLGGVRLAYNGALSKSYTAAAVVAATTIVGSLAIEWKSVRGRRIETSAESREESAATMCNEM